ncbi:MAG: methylated-DNA--[protein]-cysteine S-methyltransferase [Prevotella sp.]
MNIFVAIMPSPFGWLRLESDGDVLTACRWTDKAIGDSSDTLQEDSGDVPLCITAALRQLDEYFRGGRRTFDLPIRLCGTDFQKAVWHQLSLIPYGTTISYSTLASLIGNPNAARAVAQACHRNPLAVIIPCHRVIGANGSLTGYASGVERKRGLLDIERN